ncbi:MAG: chitinase [Clostridia bacterium]|nr:chitinase [Clostridia bacterium]
MKILAYACNENLKKITREDALMLDGVNVAFGHVGKDGLLEYRSKEYLKALDPIRAWHPGIKIVLSVGGWGAGGFSLMSRTKAGQKAFAESCADFCFKNDIDGIDIDWEYPCNDSAGIDADPSDRQNFTGLLWELRQALGKEKIVSIAAGAGSYFVRDTEMDKVAEICDYVQLMTYDMRSGFCRESGHHTAPFASKDGPKGFDTKSVTEMFIAAGVPKEKVIIGAAFYSRRWDGVPNVNNGLFQKAETVGQYGPNYHTLVEKYIDKDGFTRYWDGEAQAPYLFNGSSLISYDDPASLKAKCEYLKRAGLMGIMYWEHGSDETKTLLKALNDAR